MPPSEPANDILAELRAVFPLEERVRALPAPARRGYAEVLRHWCRRRAPPPRSILSEHTLASLIACDALVDVDGALGCYPFSARVTGHRVRLDGGSVEAMCAVDALAVPARVGAPARVSSACYGCGASLGVALNEAGEVLQGGSSSAVVHLRLTTPDAGRSCSATLCRAMRFACATCDAPDEHVVLDLAAAAGLARGFFAFQRDFLES